MKSIISRSVGIALLITPGFASATETLEGAVGEMEAGVSFFKDEINTTVAKAKKALESFESNLQQQDVTHSIVSAYMLATSLNKLSYEVENLKRLLRLLIEHKSRANQMRVMLETTRDENHSEQ